MVSIELKKIYEHDMDLLILEEFVSDRSFAKLFLSKLNLGDDYVIEKAIHSLSDVNGESDITFILKYPDRKVGILIEDKIDAVTMKDQSERYYIRGEAAKIKGEYNDYYVMLVAPEEYFSEHINDKNADYEYRLSYENLAEYFARQDNLRATFKKTVVEFALKEKKTGYQVHEDERITRFWAELRQYCKKDRPNMIMLGEDLPKGPTAVWPEFRTALKGVKVIYKSDRGYVDLEFPGYGERVGDLISIVGDNMNESMQCHRTNKSASVRIADEIMKIDFTQSFFDNIESINVVLRNISSLCDLASKLNYKDLY